MARAARAALAAVRGMGCWIIAAPDNVARATVLDRISSAISRATMLLLIAIVLVAFYEVVLRYLFGSPTLWANELTLWMGSVIFLVAGVYAMQRRAHIRITAVYDIVPRSWQIAFDIASAAAVVGYAALMIAAGSRIAIGTLLAWERSGTFWNPPIPATIKPLVLLATGLVALQAVNNLIADAFGRSSKG